MIDYKSILGFIPIVIGLASFVFYANQILKNNMKPHAFSWLVWSILDGTIFAVQVVEDGGAGAWFTGYAAVACFIVFLLSLWKGEKNIVLFDWISLGVALFSMILWWLTSDPTASVILITITASCGYLPTFRKSFSKPYEESIFVFGTGVLQYFLSILALSSLTFVTAVYPTSALILNILIVLMLYQRRRELGRQEPL